MHKLYYVLCCCIISATASSQHTLSGKISGQDNTPLAGSHVHVGSQTVSSDAIGSYSISDVPSGKTKIYISYVGFQTFDTIIDVEANLSIDFRLKQKADALAEVIVKQKSNSHNQSVPEQRLKLETIEKYSNQTLGDALKELPGVSSLKTGSTIVKPVINGMYGSRVPVINNNVRMEDQEWGTEHAPNFDINAAGKITVIKGASGLQFGGDAVGGIVVVEPISIKKDTLFGKTILNLSSNGKGGSISSSLHKGNFCDWSWNALGTFKYLGDRESPDYTLSNTGNREANFSGDVKFTGKKYDITASYSFYHALIGILSASHTGSAADLYNSINNQLPSVVNDFTYSVKNPKQQVTHHLAKIVYNRFLDETSDLSIQYAFQFNKRLEFDVRRENYNDKAALDLELATHTVNVDYKKDFEKATLKSGISASYQNNYADPSTGIRPLIPTYQKIDGGIYGVYSYRSSESLTLESGIRYDYSHIEATKYYFKTRWAERDYDAAFSGFIVGEDGNQWLTKPEFTFNNLSGSIGFHKEFQGDLNWYVNASLATRNPNPSEFFSDGLHHSTGIIELGDLKLEKEQAYKFSTTLRKKFRVFTIEVNPYLNRIDNYMHLNPIDLETTTRGVFPVWEYQQTNALLAGIDFQTQWQLASNWEHSFAFSYVNGRDLTANDALIDIPPLNFNNKIRFSKKEWSNLSMELKSEVVLRQTSYPNNNFAATIVVEGELTPVVVDISTPPPAYHLLHFYSEVKLKAFNNVSTSLAFSVQNILNTNYRDYLNRQRFFADEMGRNFQIQLKISY